MLPNRCLWLMSRDRVCDWKYNSQTRWKLISVDYPSLRWSTLYFTKHSPCHLINSPSDNKNIDFSGDMTSLLLLGALNPYHVHAALSFNARDACWKSKICCDEWILVYDCQKQKNVLYPILQCCFFERVYFVNCSDILTGSEIDVVCLC